MKIRCAYRYFITVAHLEDGGNQFALFSINIYRLIFQCFPDDNQAIGKFIFGLFRS